MRPTPKVRLSAAPLAKPVRALIIPLNRPAPLLHDLSTSPPEPLGSLRACGPWLRPGRAWRSRQVGAAHAMRIYAIVQKDGLRSRRTRAGEGVGRSLTAGSGGCSPHDPYMRPCPQYPPSFLGQDDLLGVAPRSTPQPSCAHPPPQRLSCHRPSGVTSGCGVGRWRAFGGAPRGLSGEFREMLDSAHRGPGGRGAKRRGAAAT